MTTEKKSGIFLTCGLLLILLGSIPLNGYILFLPFFNAGDHKAALGFLATAAVGVIFAAMARAAVNMHSRPRTT